MQGDTLSKIQALIGTAIAIIGVIFTYVQFRDGQIKQEVEENSQEFTVVDSLLRKCASSEKDDRRFATLLIRSLSTDGPSDKQLVYQFTKNSSFQNSLKLCFEMLSDTVQVTPVATPVPPVAVPPVTNNDNPVVADLSHWVYLGTFKNGKWETKYLDFPDDFDPTKSVAPADLKTFNVSKSTGALNVRAGEFGPTGDFPPVQKAIQPGTKVTIKNTWQWFDTGNWWARVLLP